MRVFSSALWVRYLISLMVLLVFTSVVIPWQYGITYPKPNGPKFDNHIHLQYQEFIVNNHANLVLLGDSVVVTSVDESQLARLTGQNTLNLGIPGSASAEWYLMLKNIIAKSPRKPHYVVVVFRDTILTAPSYRVNGKYFTMVDEVAKADDTLVVQKSFVQQMNPVEKLADAYLPLYGSRLNLRESIDNYIRYSLSGWLGCDINCNDNASLAVFQDMNLDANLLVEAIATAESYLYTPNQLNFAGQLDNSYLPDMVQIARDNNIQLILVRTKHLDDPSYATESAALKDYIVALKDYAQKNDVVVLDFAHDDRLTSDLFSDTHHLTPTGEGIFTGMLAEALKPVLKNP